MCSKLLQIAILDFYYNYLLNSKVFKELLIKAYSHWWKTKIIKKREKDYKSFQKQTEDDVKVATLEPHSLSPSYWKFLQRITGGKMGQVGWGGARVQHLILFIHGIFCKYHQVNRVLVDYEYGTEAAKQVNSKNSSLFSTAHKWP